MKKIYKSLLLSLVVGSFLNCGTRNAKFIKEKLNEPFYNEHFTGIMVYDPETKDTLFKQNSGKYFTPASNTKIITLFTAIHSLPKNIPAFKYKVDGDTIYIKGTGDPTFLHPYFKDSTAFDFVKNYQYLKVVYGNLLDSKFGPGWAWEDYQYYFSPERSGFPIYGNVVAINGRKRLQSTPAVLLDSVKLTIDREGRDLMSNQYYYRLKDSSTTEIPMLLHEKLIATLWENLMGRRVELIKDDFIGYDRMAYSVVSDSLYKRMMHVSDNFLAEQLLVLSAGVQFDTLDTQKIRNSILNNELSDLKQPPRWVDGSGLSRYNLFTPESFVHILSKLYQELPRERLFNLFPGRGLSEPLKNRDTENTTPYIYAKTGSLGNNYCLSGYLLTKKGKTLIFSIMNNHFLKPTREVRDEVQALLETIREKN